ncbi:MAG: metalloregulator ArsR/SmtB family transcription factor [Bacilli bacterium]|jgi:ArsR family transcriptional regulator|nr:metalloregulator ArsR/SmtB family transcription factor [Bacilli bacterium]MDY0063676.1 metalloregulator ArsR/SmtB family transcription factor [Bacilli bacterium]
MNKLDNSALLFKALGDQTRIRIIEAIMNTEKNVMQIANELNMTHSAISHQLQLLKEVNIVRFRRKGKEIFYTLSDSHIKTVVEQVFTHAMECEE